MKHTANYPYSHPCDAMPCHGTSMLVTSQLPFFTAIRLSCFGSYKHSTISPLQVRERGLALSALALL